jgi:2,4-dienoyl-CoA reductase-like NADH-dependent reductase (Old Yellow Enzyme family)
MTNIQTLFRPFSCKSLHLPNRVVMAPMTRSFSPGGVPGDDVAAYYARRAASVGLIVTEGTGIDRPLSLNDPKVPRFHGADALAGWQIVVDAVHAEGGLIAPQLWHVGAMRNPENLDFRGESPSGLARPGKSIGAAMTDADVADAIASFGRAAAAAKALGFDAVEIHGAHGYLIDEFFWPGTNARSDHYNGPTIGERSRFAADILREIRSTVGPDYPVIIRISQWKQQEYSARLAETPEQMAQWLEPLVDAGADILHCSQRRFWEPEFDGSSLNFAGWARKLTGKPTISVGSVGLTGEFVAAFGGESSQPASLDELLERMERDEFDLIAVGRALLNDPAWVDKVKAGQMDELESFSPAALGRLF